MDDAVAVRVVERFGNLNGKIQQLGRVERAAAQPLRQRFSSRYSSTRKSLASACPVSYRTQMCGWLSAAIARASSANRLRLSGHSAWSRSNHFQRHHTVQAGVARLVHFAHPARSGRAQNHVWTERVASCQLHSSLLIVERRFDPQVPDQTVEIVRMHAQQLRRLAVAASGLAEGGDDGVALGS